MLSNLLSFWIFARVVTAVTAATLCLVGVSVGAWIAVRWRRGASSEEQLSLERRAELVATVMQVALLLSIVGFALTVLVADRLVGGIRGAMCAFGVLASTGAGYYGLLASYVTAVACSLWIVLHRLDMRLESPVLTRRKFLYLIVVAPLCLCDVSLVVVFALQLDFSVIASCCSVWLDGSIASTEAAQVRMSPAAAGLLGLSATLGALAAAAAAWRWPGRVTTILASAVSAVAPVAILPAILFVVAPHALVAPQHPCPFCLLHAQGGGIGWPLFSGIFLGSVVGMGLGVVEVHRGASGDPRQVSVMQQVLARWSAIAWACVLLVGAFPVVRYLVKSGGVFVYGEI